MFLGLLFVAGYSVLRPCSLKRSAPIIRIWAVHIVKNGTGFFCCGGTAFGGEKEKEIII